MRISKLFHWLYASIMLMPIFAIGVKSLYVTFNPNAKDSYTENTQTIQIPVYYESNESSSNLDLVIGNIYYIENKDNDPTESNRIQFSYSTLVPISYSFLSRAYTTTSTLNSVAQIFNYNNNHYFRIFYNEEGTNYYRDYYDFSGYVVFNGGISPSSAYTYFDETDYQYIKEYIPYTYTDTIDNVFYYSVEQISNESLFSWANGTFLAQPLLFITNLFGVPSTSPIITILCYWFAISVIWLVFDVIMYIPLLVHRWLDKGVIE